MTPTSKALRDLAIWQVTLGLAAGGLAALVTVRAGTPSASAAYVALWLAAGAAFGACSAALTRVVLGAAVAARHETSGAADAHAAPDAHAAYVAFSEAVVAGGEVDALATDALVHYRRHVGAVAATVLYEADGDLVPAASFGFADAHALARHPDVVAAARSGERRERSEPAGFDLEGGAPSAVGTVVIDPIVGRGVRLGVVVVAAEHAFDDAERARIDVFGRTLALALHAALAHDRLQRLAALDPLTGMLNRRFGLERLREEFARSTRDASALGVLMIDVDDFKAVNAEHGHAVGDRVLRTVALVTRAALRDGDVLCRYAGEEFLVVLPGAGAADVAQVAERVRALAANATLVEGARGVRVTLSLGGAARPDAAVESEEDLVRLADEALSIATRAGGDTVRMAP